MRVLLGKTLKWSVLIVLLALYGILGRYAPYLLLVSYVILLPYLLFTARERTFRLGIADGGFLLAFGLLLLAFVLSAKQSADALMAVNFAWLLLFVPVRSFFDRNASQSAPLLVARLSLLGTVLLLLMAVYERAMLGEARVGYLTSDAIRIANTAVILGALSTIGLLAEHRRLRLIYLAGPLAALIVAYLAGTRGAIASLALLFVVISVFVLWRRPWGLLVGAAIALLAVAALLVAARLHVPRIDSLVGTLQQLWRGEAVSDASANIRLAMQRTAIAAFSDSPWVGHGWRRIVSAAAAYLPPTQAHLFDGQPHLHSDLADFAVAGGVLGLLAYATALLAPVIAAVRSVKDSGYRVRLFGVVLVVASYFALGLNSLMLGFEVHTALYCGLIAILLGYCREPVPSPADRSAQLSSETASTM